MRGRKTGKKVNRCGDCHKCCEHYVITVNMSHEVDLLSRTWGVIGDKDDFLYLDVDTPCQHLTKDGCDIYDTRPKTCRDFVCNTIREDK